MASNYLTCNQLRNISLTLLICLVYSLFLPLASTVSAQGVDTETPTPTITETSTETPTELPSDAPTSTSTQDPFATATPTATITPLPVDPGTYDDKYFQIRYDGWILHALTGTFQNSNITQTPRVVLQSLISTVLELTFFSADIQQWVMSESILMVLMWLILTNSLKQTCVISHSLASRSLLVRTPSPFHTLMGFMLIWMHSL